MSAIVKGLAHIGVIVKDMDASIDFYKRLGFSLDKEEKLSNRLAFLSAGTCLIELIERKDGEKRSAGTVDHIAMEVEDIAEAVKNTKATGIEIDDSKIASAPILGGIKNIFFDGPDGERLEFFAFSK